MSRRRRRGFCGPCYVLFLLSEAMSQSLGLDDDRPRRHGARLCLAGVAKLCLLSVGKPTVLFGSEALRYKLSVMSSEAPLIIHPSMLHMPLCTLCSRRRETPCCHHGSNTGRRANLRGPHLVTPRDRLSRRCAREGFCTHEVVEHEASVRGFRGRRGMGV